MKDIICVKFNMYSFLFNLSSLTLSMYVGTKIHTVYFASLFVDHAGWTPLHEACNHGSTECVKALLQHCPNLQLGSQVRESVRYTMPCWTNTQTLPRCCCGAAVSTRHTCIYILRSDLHKITHTNTHIHTLNAWRFILWIQIFFT